MATEIADSEVVKDGYYLALIDKEDTKLETDYTLHVKEEEETRNKKKTKTKN